MQPDVHRECARERGVGRERWLRDRGMGSGQRQVGGMPAARGFFGPRVVDELPGTVARKDVMG